jgi:hypothetical protein
MANPTGDDGALIPVSTRFHSLVRRPGGVSREQAIHAAEAKIGTLQPQFADWLDRELENLIAVLPGGQAEATSEDPWLDAAYVHCRAMRDVGATMGFELLTFAANNLCDIIEIVKSGVDCPFDAVESQLSALLLARKEVARALSGTRRG